MSFKYQIWLNKVQIDTYAAMYKKNRNLPVEDINGNFQGVCQKLRKKGEFPEGAGRGKKVENTEIEIEMISAIERA